MAQSIVVVQPKNSSSELYSAAEQFFEDGQYEKAILAAEKDLLTTPIKQQSEIYLLLGRAQAELKFFESALVSLELAIDLSDNSNLDKLIDSEIESVIRKQQMFDRNRLKNRMALSLGLGYDTNVLNVNANSYPGVDLKAVSAIYGFTYSRKAVTTVDATIVPEFNFQDNYSLNSSLKTESTVQSNDAMIWSFTVPYIQYRRIVNPYDYVKYQLIYQNIYLPLGTTKRSLAYVSAGFSNEYLLNFSNWYVLVPSVSLFSDSSHLTVTDPANDTTATRLHFKFLNLFNISNTGSRRASFRVEYINNNARGDNTFYNRFVTGVGYNFDWIYEVLINTELKYQMTNYSKTASSRKDNLSGIDFELTKQLDPLTRLGAVASYQSTQSTSESYKYNDSAISFFYNKAFEF